MSKQLKTGSVDGFARAARESEARGVVEVAFFQNNDAGDTITETVIEKVLEAVFSEYPDHIFSGSLRLKPDPAFGRDEVNFQMRRMTNIDAMAAAVHAAKG